MKTLAFALLAFLTLSACQSQTKTNSTTEERQVGGRCEGCEALLEYGDRTLTTTDTLPYFKETEPKLKVKGTVYHKDGKTPAKDIIIYMYHTDRDGIYPTDGDETGWARRHGKIRGWIKTDATGKYTFYTFRPGAYPNRQTFEHIHLTVKEPNTIPYYIDDIVFEDDTLLTAQDRKRFTQRAGSGVVMPKLQDGMLSVKRDIVLGKSIPGY